MKYPKIKSVKAKSNYILEVVFDNNIKKIYDCNPLLTDDNFKPLKKTSIFNNVHIDKFGYGIIWNSQLDLSESELWLKGKSV